MWQIEWCEEIDSTNAELLRRSDRREPLHGTALIAKHQTNGRGQHGRVWTTAPSEALLLSVAYEFPKHTALSGLSLVVGLAVREALAALSFDAKLKWPNDVYLGGEKVAGILVECRGALAVVGIGINLDMSEPRPMATALSKHGQSPSLTSCSEKVLSALQSFLERFQTQGFAPSVASFNAHHLYHHQMVSIHVPDQAPIVGEVVGVDAYGALCLTTEMDTRTIHSGTLRPLP